MSTAKMVFHGSDIEKICEVYQSNSLQDGWISCLLIQTEIILHFAAQFQNIVIFLLNSSFPEMVPAN